MAQEPEKSPKVVDLAAARKRQKTLRVGGFAKKDKGPRDKGRPPNGPGGRKLGIWAYVQLVLFLALVAYMMQLCSGGGLF